jgi:FkbM family methyltransferase
MIYRKEVDGFNWILNVSDGGIGATLYNAKSPGKDYNFARESVFMQLLDTTIKEGMTCIDLGANIGYATMFMLRNVGDPGTVYAIEPDPHNLRMLKINLAENGYNVKCEKTQCLISDKDGKNEFWIARHPNLNSVKKTKHSIRREIIDCFTLETFCSTRKYPNFIKMDIEGHEVSVFEGAYNYFKENDGETHILLEVHPQYYDENNDFAAILEKYYDIGFKIKYLVSTPVQSPAPFINRGYKPITMGTLSDSGKTFNAVRTDGWVRQIYENVKKEDAIELACKLQPPFYKVQRPGANWETKGGKVVRSIMVSREKQ